MKRLFAVFFMVILIMSSGNFFEKRYLYKTFEDFNVKQVILYTNINTLLTNPRGLVDSQQNCNGVNNVYNINLDILKDIELGKTDFHGVEFVLNKTINLNEIFAQLNAKVVRSEQVCERTLVYAYSNKFAKTILDSGEKINIQVCVNDDRLIVGYPILLGSY